MKSYNYNDDVLMAATGAGFMAVECMTGIYRALGMSYFQAKFPVLFTPGLKLIGLTFLSGLTLCVLPALTQNTMIWIMGLFSSMAILLVFILSKTFTTSTK